MPQGCEPFLHRILKPMANRVRVADARDFTPGQSRTVEIEGREVTIVRSVRGWHAFDDRCPHRGARLSRGTLTDESVSCPLHGWTFDLESGQCAESQTDCLQLYPVIATDDDLLVEFPEARSESDDDVFRYLVRFGAMGWTERLGSVHAVGAERGQRVVIHSSRGLEIGEVLATSEPGSDRIAGSLTGEVLRTVSDEEQQTWIRLQEAAIPEIDQVQEIIDRLGLNLQIIDGEVLLDELTVILYFLGTAPENPDTLLEQLKVSGSRRIQLESTDGTPIRASGGCGSGGCGSGGCGSGGCGTDAPGVAGQTTTGSNGESGL